MTVARDWAVIAPNWLGDAVMCLPALAELRRQQPGVRLRVHARPAVAPVFAAADLDLEIRAAPRPRGLGLAALLAMWRARGPRPELALLLPNSFFSALAARALGARRVFGYARAGRAPLLTTAVPPPRPGEIPEHESFQYLELCRRAGLIATLPERPAAHLAPDPALVARCAERLGGAAAVALHAGASYGTAKRWLPERFAATVAALAGQGLSVVLVGAADEREVARQVCEAAVAGGAPPNLVANFAGRTSLPELLALLSYCRLLIANDSGPMHVAAALGTPVVAIFGSTNERQTFPLARPGRLRLVKAPNIECSPCKLRECPIDHRCMTRIGAQEVIAAARELLAAAPAPAR